MNGQKQLSDRNHIERCTRHFFFALEPGRYVLSRKCVPGYSVGHEMMHSSFFEGYICSKDRREEQWQQVIKAGVEYFDMMVFTSKSERCLWADDYVKAWAWGLRGGHYWQDLGTRIKVQKLSFSGDTAILGLRYPYRDENLSYPRENRVAQRESVHIIHDPRMVELLRGLEPRYFMAPLGVADYVRERYMLIGAFGHRAQTGELWIEVIDSSPMKADVEHIWRKFKEARSCEGFERSAIIDRYLCHLMDVDKIMHLNVIGIFDYVGTMHR